jgi:hypothetical protein
LEPVDRLLAYTEIGQLLGRYCLMFDDQDWDALAGIWTDDAAFLVDGVGFEGRDAVLEFLRTCLPPGYQSKHLISPPVIDLAEDGMSATARTDVVWIAQNFREHHRRSLQRRPRPRRWWLANPTSQRSAPPARAGTATDVRGRAASQQRHHAARLVAGKMSASHQVHVGAVSQLG